MNAGPAQAKWHIVLCEPNREFTAVAGMTDRGFEAMTPADYVRRPTGKRDQSGRPVLSMEASPKAFIPGYAFLHCRGSDKEYHTVRIIKGVRDFYKTPSGDPDHPRLATLTEEEIGDLRTLDDVAFERFRCAVNAEKHKREQEALPKEKREPSVPFLKGKAVRVFSTVLGKQLHGAMLEKRAGGMVKIMVDHVAMLVPHYDLQEGDAA